jgi:hypothetical protein
MSSSALAVQTALRDRLLIHAPLTALLGGGHVFDEIPRGEQEPYVAFAGIETRDWSVQTQTAHEHYIAIEIKTKSRGRKQAEEIVAEIEAAFDSGGFALAGHTLVNLRLLFWTVSRSQEKFGAVMRYRAATEPN